MPRHQHPSTIRHYYFELDDVSGYQKKSCGGAPRDRKSICGRPSESERQEQIVAPPLSCAPCISPYFCFPFPLFFHASRGMGHSREQRRNFCRRSACFWNRFPRVSRSQSSRLHNKSLPVVGHVLKSGTCSRCTDGRDRCRRTKQLLARSFGRVPA